LIAAELVRRSSAAAMMNDIRVNVFCVRTKMRETRDARMLAQKQTIKTITAREGKP
jgi:hypothetical protein